MKDNTIIHIIQEALVILEKDVGLAESTLRVVKSRSFKPISDFFEYTGAAEPPVRCGEVLPQKSVYFS